LRLKKYLVFNISERCLWTSSENLLADVVVTNTKQANSSNPGCDNLAGQLAAYVLPVCAESDNATNKREANGIAQHNWVVGVLLDLLLCGVLLCCRLVLDVLGFPLDLLFTLLAFALRVGLDGL
jgi:hypothetical protein